jgi:hypothetical protein
MWLNTSEYIQRHILESNQGSCVYACNLKGATAYIFMTGSAGVRNQSLIAFFLKRWRSSPLHPTSPLGM